jgi:transcription antitermination factor NusG
MVEDLGIQDKVEEIIVPTEDVIEIKNGSRKWWNGASIRGTFSPNWTWTPTCGRRSSPFPK